MALAWLKNLWSGTLTKKSRSAEARGKYKPSLIRLEDRIVPITAVTNLTVITPTALVANLVGTNSGINAFNIKYTGDLQAAGTFTGGANSVGLATGVILSTGLAAQAVGPNIAAVPSTNLLQPGDAQLDAIAAPNLTHDAAVLEFDFIPTGNTITLSFLYGSGDYNAGVGTPPGDPMGIFVNGTQSAFVPGTSTNINPTTVNGTVNSQFYIDNTNPGGRNTRMHGFTRVLNGTFTVKAGEVNHLKLAIADNTTFLVDSYLLLGAGSMTTGTINAYRPLRYVYNSGTNTYDGNLTIINRFDNDNDVQGFNVAVLSDLPTSVTTVTVANPTGFTASGDPYFTFPNINGVLSNQQPVRVPISLRNPKNISMSTFFLGYEIDVTTSLA